MNYFTLQYESFLTVGLVILSTVIVLFAQLKIKTTYKKYKTIGNSKKLSGQEVARKILDRHGLSNIYVVETQGELTDHYDPKRKVIRLSSDIYHSESIAAISVAAHECGHAIQDKENYAPMRIRTFLVPIVNLVSYLGYFSLIITIFTGIMGYFKLGIIILAATILFQLVTLPVEFDASKRAIKELEKTNSVTKNEKEDAKKMLTSAALTYVASALSSILDLLRLVIMANNARDRD